jgi:hypothetical protein
MGSSKTLAAELRQLNKFSGILVSLCVPSISLLRAVV